LINFLFILGFANTTLKLLYLANLACVRMGVILNIMI